EPLHGALWPYERVALRMHGDAPGHHVHELGHAVGLAARLDEVAAGDERPQRSADGLGLVRVNRQRARDFAHGGGVSEPFAAVGKKVVGARHAAYRLHPTPLPGWGTRRATRQSTRRRRTATAVRASPSSVIVTGSGTPAARMLSTP